MNRAITAATLALAAATPASLAQFDPNNGSWLKDDPANVRVMTWNVRDGIVSSAGKSDTANAWNSIARHLAALQPDVLIIQEAGDGPGGADSVSNLEQTFRILIEGTPDGSDPFTNGAVSSWVQKFAPAYDLPHVFVSPVTDGFNRNIIASRFPFADINNDGQATYADFAIQTSDQWALPGGGEIRGFGFAEIDLPDATYPGDLVIGNSHLDSGGACSDYNARVRGARNISYFIEYYYNGNQTAQTDPNNAIAIPSSGNILSPATPVIWGGDWNNTPFETQNCSLNDFNKSPVRIITEGQSAGGSDGPDRDGSDAARDNARDFNTNSTGTLGSSKLDYIAWQDSVLQQQPTTQFVFNSGTLSTNQIPTAIASFPVQPSAATGFASDHKPVVVDFPLNALPAAGPPVFSTFAASPNPTSYDDTITLDAAVFNPDGSVTGTIDFFLESDGTPGLNASTDTPIAQIAPDNPAGISTPAATFSPQTILSPAEFQALFNQSITFYARATDNQSTTTVANTTLQLINEPPTIDNAAATPSTLRYNDATAVTADINDPDWLIASARFVFDQNNDNQLDPADTLLADATPADPANPATVQTTLDIDAAFTPAEFAARLGTNRVFLEVADEFGLTTTRTITLNFSGEPYLTDFSANPNPVTTGQPTTVSITAQDPDSNISSIALVLDDGDQVYEPFADDQTISFVFGTNTSSAIIPAADLNTGTNTVFAEVSSADNDSLLASLTIEVTECTIDFDGSGSVGFGDVSEFIARFNDNDPSADLDNSGSVGFGDVSEFIARFNAGC